MNLDIFRRTSEHTLADEKRRLEKANNKAEARIKELEKSLSKSESQCQQAESQLRARDKDHQYSINNLKRDHDRAINEAKDRYRRLEETNASILKETIKGYDRRIEGLNTNHQSEADRLKGQLITPKDQNQGWPDDKLKTHFKELQRLIDSVTSPINNQFVVAPGQRVGPQLDPTDFCGRNGTEKYDFVLKSLVWTILRDQFFSLPFGFGALGPGDGQKAILDVFYSWRELFHGYGRPAFPDEKDFEIFQRDKFANEWRCATFKSIQESLAGHVGGNDDGSESRLINFSADSHNQTVNRIMEVLREISKLGNNGPSIPRQIENEVQQLVIVARQIAFQFGIHSAQLQLYSPGHGDRVLIGPECHDCEDGDSDRGKRLAVDLVVVPSLQKIGDGWFDMTTKRAIVPCEIYPYLNA